MNSIILHHHLGLGDHFVCNGLVHQISRKYNSIYIPCKIANYSTVNYLYSESPNINVFKVHNNEFLEVLTFSTLTNLKIVTVGFGNCDIKNWDRSFYSEYNIDFSERYKSFSAPKTKPDFMISVPSEDYILVHDESSVCKYDLNIETNLNIVKIRNGLTDNLFSFLNLIENAKEIHCINSSVFHLIDSLNTVTKKLFYHDVRRTDDSKFKVSEKWKIVDY